MFAILYGHFLFKDFILFGVKVLYKVLIPQLIVNMFLFYLFFEEVVLFCKYFRAGMCIGFFVFNDSPSFI